MHRSIGIALIFVLGGGACGDDGATHKDAQVDTAPGGEGGMCGAETYFTGEFVDWKSTDTDFCGVFDAKWQVHGDATRTSMTAPNGRFQLCVPSAATTQVDVTPAASASPCASAPGTYTIPGIAIANKAVIDAGGLFSARAITTEQIATFFTPFSLTFSTTKAHVFVHVEGTPRAVSITSTHDTTLAFSGTAWAEGNTGKNVYFPNVDPAGGTTAVSVTGGAIGTGSIPVVAGTFTYVTVVAN